MSTASEARTRPIVLVLASYYLPGFRSGGPVRSLSNLIEALGDEFEFHVITRDRDLNAVDPYPESLEGTTRIGKADIRYLRPSVRVPWQIRRAANELAPDLLYFNSFFDALFTVFPLWARRAGLIRPTPALVAPRGEFSSGALGLKSLKKRVYLALARPAGIVRGIHWHATGDAEKSDIARTTEASDGEISIAPNLGRASAAESRAVRSKPTHALAIAFVSRISPMKNLVFAIDVVRLSRVPIKFDIYGPIGDESYWRQCQEAMRNLPAHVSITYRGAVPNESVPEVLASYDAFFLPSLGENYGHALVEAFNAGLPVLVSDRTPWRRLREAGAGYDLPLADESAFVKALEELANRSDDEVKAAREAVLAYARGIHADSDAVNRTRNMFQKAISDDRSGR